MCPAHWRFFYDDALYKSTLSIYLSISSGDKEGVPKFSSRTPYAETFMCARSLPDFSIVSLCIMQLCEYVFPIGFPLYVPKNVFLGGFEGEDVKILCSDPRKALPCMNMCLLVCIACQNRFSGLSSRSVEKFCVERKKF